jgi:hypothetical protein
MGPQSRLPARPRTRFLWDFGDPAPSLGVDPTNFKVWTDGLRALTNMVRVQSEISRGPARPDSDCRRVCGPGRLDFKVYLARKIWFCLLPGTGYSGATAQRRSKPLTKGLWYSTYLVDSPTVIVPSILLHRGGASSSREEKLSAYFSS